MTPVPCGPPLFSLTLFLSLSLSRAICNVYDYTNTIYLIYVHTQCIVPYACFSVVKEMVHVNSCHINSLCTYDSSVFTCKFRTYCLYMTLFLLSSRACVCVCLGSEMFWLCSLIPDRSSAEASNTAMGIDGFQCTHFEYGIASKQWLVTSVVLEFQKTWNITTLFSKFQVWSHLSNTFRKDCDVKLLRIGHGVSSTASSRNVSIPKGWQDR